MREGESSAGRPIQALWKLLVWCLAYSWCFAARDFGLPLGGSDEHTLQRSVRSDQRRGRPKDLLPEGLRRKWPGASLLLSHRSLRICSFVAPRPRPFWAQRNTSYLRDTTLAGPCPIEAGWPVRRLVVFDEHQAACEDIGGERRPKFQVVRHVQHICPGFLPVELDQKSPAR